MHFLGDGHIQIGRAHAVAEVDLADGDEIGLLRLRQGIEQGHGLINAVRNACFAGAID